MRTQQVLLALFGTSAQSCARAQLRARANARKNFAVALCARARPWARAHRAARMRRCAHAPPTRKKARAWHSRARARSRALDALRAN